MQTLKDIFKLVIQKSNLLNLVSAADTHLWLALLTI